MVMLVMKTENISFPSYNLYIKQTLRIGIPKQCFGAK